MLMIVLDSDIEMITNDVVCTAVNVRDLVTSNLLLLLLLVRPDRDEIQKYHLDSIVQATVRFVPFSSATYICKAE